jgi:hypothetical protein
MEFGIRDKEKEGWLEQVRNMAGGNLLSLVLPEGSTVSAKTLRLDGLPSASYRENASGTDSRGVGNVLDRLIVCEYLTRYFKKFQKVCPEEEFYELEYLLNGSSSDRENLSAVLARLTALRTGLNLASILADSEKRGEARTLALAITGGTGILPLVSVMTFFIMSQWALGEALQDDKCLLSGGKVPLLKGKGDWKLDLDGLLEVGKNRKLMESGETEETRGLDYTGYLRILLFSSYGREMIYRAMDVMQLVIGRSQPGFAMEDCACLVDMEGTVSGKHLFFSLGLWKNLFPEGENGYETVMEVSGDYFDSP